MKYRVQEAVQPANDSRLEKLKGADQCCGSRSTGSVSFPWIRIRIKSRAGSGTFLFEKIWVFYIVKNKKIFIIKHGKWAYFYKSNLNIFLVLNLFLSGTGSLPVPSVLTWIGISTVWIRIRNEFFSDPGSVSNFSDPQHCGWPFLFKNRDTRIRPVRTGSRSEFWKKE